MARNPSRVGPRFPQVVVLVGATGDLSRRKLLPGLFHLASAGFIPGIRIIGVSLDDLDPDAFRGTVRAALDQFCSRKVTGDDWSAFAECLDYVPLAAGAQALSQAVERAEQSLASESRRIHYLSVPPAAALSAVRLLAEADLVSRCRIIMEKPFGIDLDSAVSLNAQLHEVFSEDQIFRIDHFLGKEAAQNILAFRFANGLFEPIWNRNFIDHVQIDVPETLGLGQRAAFYEATGAFRDMVVTHLFQILAFMAMEPPTSLEPAPISEEKNKVFRSMLPLEPKDVVRGQYVGYRAEQGVDPESDTETFIALKCAIDNWRWAGVPFFLRTGKRLAEGQRIISIAFREPPKSMFPVGSGVGAQGPDHLTFDLADASKMSLSFYGKRPGPGMRLDKLSLQFAMHDTGWIDNVLEAYERLILDAMRGDHTLFTTSEGIERLCEVAVPLLEAPPPVRLYQPASWGPKSIHQLVAPHAWRLSTVSKLCKDIDERVNGFLERPLEGGWPYLWLDATYLKVREGGRIVSVAAIIAVAVNTEGKREIVGLGLGPSEAETFWSAFLKGLLRRGLRGVKLVISDAHEGLKHAIGPPRPPGRVRFADRIDGLLAINGPGCHLAALPCSLDAQRPGPCASTACWRPPCAKPSCKRTRRPPGRPGGSLPTSSAHVGPSSPASWTTASMTCWPT